MTERARTIPRSSIDVSKLKWAPAVMEVAELAVDMTYQRHIVKHLVSAIAANYNPLLAGMIVVSQRNGTAYIVDGQQRWHGARGAGIPSMATLTIHGLDQKTEARLYLELNEGRVAVRAIDRFRGAYVAGEPYAVDITNIVHEFGGRIYGLDEPVRDVDIQAVEALRWIYSKGGVKGLRETLEVFVAAFGEINQPSCPGMLLKGVFGMITVHREDIDRDRLARQISATGTAQLATLAHGMGQILGAAAGQRSYYLALVQAYNDRLRSGALQPVGTLNMVGSMWKRILAEDEEPDEAS